MSDWSNDPTTRRPGTWDARYRTVAGSDRASSQLYNGMTEPQYRRFLEINGVSPEEIDRMLNKDSNTQIAGRIRAAYAEKDLLGPIKDVDKFVRENYGQLAWALDDDEIGPILRRAAQEEWDPIKLFGAIQGTNWWRNTSAAARTWDQLLNEDPAEAARLVNQAAATVQNRARSLGIPLGAGQIQSIARSAAQNGWTDAQVVDQVMRQVNWATLEAGDLTALRDDVKSVASSYLVGVSDATAQQYAARIASGEMTMQGVRSAMVKQAKSRFSWMSSELDQGITVRDYLQPVRDTIARELEIAPDAVDLTDGKWLGMVEVPDEKGGMRAATLNEAMLAARRRPEWAATRNAQETTTNMIGMIADVFGRRGI